MLVSLAFADKFDAKAKAKAPSDVTANCWAPIFAGFWYDKDPSKLRRALSNLLSAAGRRAKPGLALGVKGEVKRNPAGRQDRVLAAIVPHASYEYSGLTAAYVYSALRGRKFGRIFVLGPAHRESFHGCALPDVECFSTPLGKLKVDTSIVQSLKQYALFRAQYDRPRKEHSIEMQLPMIQQTFGDVPIVPIEVGQLKDQSEVRSVSRTLKRFVASNDLVIVSTDFTHWGPRYHFEPDVADTVNAAGTPTKAATVEKINQAKVDKIKTLDRQAFSAISRCEPKQFMAFKERTQDTICGYYPCSVLLAMLPRHCAVSLLHYDNSSRVNKAPDGNMVSYMAIVFSTKNSNRR